MSPENRSYASVLGDVVASRKAPQRGVLQRQLSDGLRLANELSDARQPLEITIGDEFQGLYVDVGEALRAALLVRLTLLGTMDVRFGIGWGELPIEDPSRSPYGQDGPAWWAAREAISEVKRRTRAREPAGLATMFVHADTLRAQETLPLMEDQQTETDRLQALVNGVLVARDALIAQMDDRDARIALGLLSGRRQEDIASIEKVSQSAVSQRVGKGGIGAMLEAHRLCEKGLAWNT